MVWTVESCTVALVCVYVTVHRMRAIHIAVICNLTQYFQSGTNRIQPDKLRSMKNNIRKWDDRTIKMNVYFNPWGFQSAGQGPPNSIPDDIAFMTYKKCVSVSNDPHEKLHKKDITQWLSDNLKSNGYDVYATQSALEQAQS